MIASAFAVPVVVLILIAVLRLRVRSVTVVHALIVGAIAIAIVAGGTILDDLEIGAASVGNPNAFAANACPNSCTSTDTDATVEEVLGALSLLLSGGGLAQLHTIAVELNTALDGRETTARDLLAQLDTFVGGLDKQKQDIVRALDGMDRLTSRLAAQHQTLVTALRDIPPGVAVLADQRAQLTQVLTGLSRLGVVATRVIAASQQNTVADLRALEPILRQLNSAGKDLPDSLELLTTYPFPRTVDEGIKGDFANLWATADINLVGAGGNTGIIPGPVASAIPTLPPLPVPLPTLVPKVPLPSLVPGLPGVGGLASGESPGLLSLLLGGLS